MMKIKTFEELTTRELYELLKLRTEVFVVEQKSIYQDMDDIDYQSIHLFTEDENGHVTGCVRVFRKEDEPGTAQIGRLVALERKTGLGRRLMEAAEETARTAYGADTVCLTGRESALGFYQKLGYTVDGPRYVGAYGAFYLLRKVLAD